MNNDILAKLQKILAKADPARGATEAEAQSAMAMAQRLAIQHNIDLASVTVTDAIGCPNIETDRAELDGETATRRLHHESVAQVLIKCFDVAFLWRGTGSKCIIIGEKVDVFIATYCWEWLNTTYLELFRQYAKTHPSHYSERIQRKSYYDGLTLGIVSVNQRQRAEAAASADGASFALVVATKKAAVDARVAEDFPNVKKGREPRRRTEIDRSALHNGHTAGKQIKLNNGLDCSTPAPALA
jgi:hypothetical protein